MHAARQSLPGLQKVVELIEAVGPGMLTTVNAEGQLGSRPMSPLLLDEDGALWFFSRRAFHADGPTPVNLAFVQPDQALYLSISGNGFAVEDRRRVGHLWSSTARLWFADGPEDPQLLLLRVDIVLAVCWDPTCGAMRRLFPPP
jgi:general stress protein 26